MTPAALSLPPGALNSPCIAGTLTYSRSGMHGDRILIDAQLRGLRQRLNAFELQNVLYLFASVTFLLASLVVILALRWPSEMFAVAFWLGLAFTTLGLAFAALHLHRRWFTLRRAALLADRRAKLEERLATLVTLPAPPPIFATLLSREVATLAPRWAPKVLVPHAVPRSLFLLAASILVFTATLFVERKPKAPVQLALRTTLPTAAARQVPPTPEKQPSSQESGAPSSANGEGSTGGGMMEEAGDGLSSPGLGAIASGEGFQKSQPLPATRRNKPSDSFPLPPLPSDAIAERVQSLLRAALGASGTPHHREENGRQPRLSRQTTDRPSDAKQRSGGEQRQHSENEEKKRHPQRRHADAGGDRSPGGPGGSQRASGAPGSGGAGLFGKPDRSAKMTATLTRFEVHLTGSSQPVRYHMEPQAQPRGGKAAAGIAAGSSTIAPVSAEDIADAPLHRTEVAPEMESIIGKIFTTRANQ